MKNSNVFASRVFTGLTVVALVFALSVTGVLAGFWRVATEANPSQFLYGWGNNAQDMSGDFSYGYGYGYGYGSFAAGYAVSTSTVSPGGGGGGAGVRNPDTDTDGDGDNNDGDIGSESCVFPNISVSYSDVDGNWAQSYIDDLSSKGIMNGVNSTLEDPAGMFQPERATTRIEMLKIALRTFCYEYKDLAGNENFADVEDGSWQARVIERANQLGIIDATNTDFRPNDMVSRAEALKMILNVGETRSVALTVEDGVNTSIFTDVDAPWQAKYLEKARSLGIINGQEIDGNLVARPADAITRAETSKMAKRTQDLWNGWTQAPAQ